jgi:dTMP kinase
MGQNQGYFITFEGGEGSGKSTQVKFLADHLRAQGHDVVLTREPGGTPEAEKIRDLLVRNDGGNWSPLEECLLLFAARAHHVRTLIKPAIEAGKIVISDRFTDSTRAYQGYGLGVTLKKIEALNTDLIDGFAPDLTLLLDIDVKDGLARSTRRLADEQSSEDRYENLDLEFHEKLRAGFLDMAKHEPERFRVIDADKSVDEIADEIKTALAVRLGLR